MCGKISSTNAQCYGATVVTIADVDVFSQTVFSWFISGM